MKKFKLTATILCLAFAATAAFSAAAHTGAKAEEPARELVMLGAYENAAIPENNAHDAEYSLYDTNPAKRLDIGLRAPGANGVMDGDPLTNPGCEYGNGVNVAQGIAKYRVKYAGGSLRLRYGYTVDLKNTNINLRFTDTGNQNGHLNFTFSNDYMAVSHDALSFNGITLDIYKDSPTAYQSALISAHNRRAIDGINQTVFNFPASDSDPESLCFSVYTYFTEGSYRVKVMNKNATAEYVLPASLNGELTREDGLTNIGMNCFYNWVDSDPYYMTFVMEIKDSVRAEYEKTVTEPLKAQLAGYSAEAIGSATIGSIEDVNAFVAKKAAIDGTLVAKLRVSDRDLLGVNAHIAAADAALKEKAGATVKTYLDGEIARLNKTFETALSDEGYKTIVKTEDIDALKTAYGDAESKVNTTYATLVTCTEEEKGAWTNALRSCANALERLAVSKAIYDGEQMPLTTAEELVAAKAKYNVLSGSEFISSIDDLSATDAVKADLKGRISAFGEKIAKAEQNLDKADVIDGQIANYENAPIATVADMRAALALKDLIEDYSDLDEAEAFAARIAAKDKAIENAAYGLLKEKLDRLGSLTKAGVKKNSEKKALSSAIAAIGDLDLLSDEKRAEVNESLAAANGIVKGFGDKMDELGWVLASQGGGEADTADAELLENGIRFRNGGNGDQMLYTKKIPFGENDAVAIRFSVKAFAYLGGDGKARGSNNTWIFFADKLQQNGAFVNRTTENAISLMFWNQVESSFVKSYTTEFGDTERDQTNMQTFGENDGSYVVVILKKNAAKQRFELLTTLYSKDGEETDASLNMIPYTDKINAETFKDGLYVGFSAWADENNKYFNEWDIGYVGTEAGYDKPDQPTESTSDGKDQESKSSETISEGKKDKGCFGSVSGTALFGMVAAGGVMLARKRRKNDE